MQETPDSAAARWRWVLRGQVQGVGFRPFVYRLAYRFRLAGFVRNDGSGVTIEGQASPPTLAAFNEALVRECPTLARIEEHRCETIRVAPDDDGFRIDRSSEARPSAGAGVTVDTAVCGDCLAELFDPDDRRTGYALINCTNCGPRFTIIRRIPYDRPNTTMAAFRMCEACEAEYSEPLDRRFHAQPIACHGCGPDVEWVSPTGVALPDDPIRAAARTLEAGKIVAIKGLGGFHLAVRSDDAAAVNRLRRRKHRDVKPFALMCRSEAAVRRHVAIGPESAKTIDGPETPIVLATRRDAAPVAHGVAPESHRLGVMLPYTPIHHLLFAALDEGIDALVMTSGNLTDEPLVIDNDEATRRLGGLCDGILRHDRPIERCVDDSVVLDMGDEPPLPLRRSRGYAPARQPLPTARTTAGLCVGGELKNTVTVVRDGQAIASQHLGDLKHPLALESFKKTVGDLCLLFDLTPQWVACDLHPRYLSSDHARRLASRWAVPLMEIQHHHAHAAAALAEHGEAGPALAIVGDGVGYGPDGTVWGGELLAADVKSYRRLARLRPVRLPGGDAAAKETRRCGLGLLHLAFGEGFESTAAARELVGDDGERRMLSRMIERDLSCATSSAAGRLFDGVAALLGLCERNAFEARAGMTLEAAAWRSGRPPVDGEDEATRRFSIEEEPQGDGLRRIDVSPLIRDLLERKAGGVSVDHLAADFHEQLATAWADAAEEQARALDLWTVALSGGVFCNERLTAAVRSLLERRSMRVLRHRVFPPNDGGLSFGQAAVATARAAEEASAGVEAHAES